MTGIFSLVMGDDVICDSCLLDRGDWYMKTINDKLLTLEKQKLGKTVQEEEDEIRRNIQTTNQSWNDWKF